MSVAQRLYENGFITYMRTDSTTLSDTARGSGPRPGRTSSTAPSTSRTSRARYANKVKNAQEAHEAIRPAGDSFRTPGADRADQRPVPALRAIWMRTVASQMKDAVGQSVTIRLGGAAAGGEDVVFSASGRVITFHGFLKAYVEGTDDAADARGRRPDPAAEPRRGRRRLPRRRSRASGHETKPPARYTEATLIKELEEREIGRPSTYASIIGTILNRGYVYKKGTALVPAWLAFSVIAAAGGALPAADLVRVHRRDGGRPRRDRGGPQGPQHRGSASSTSAPATSTV